MIRGWNSKSISADNERRGVAFIAFHGSNIFKQVLIQIFAIKKSILYLLVVLMAVVLVIILPSASHCKEPRSHDEEIYFIRSYRPKHYRIVASKKLAVCNMCAENLKLTESAAVCC